jgi:NTP pyrophosphatase (non-canonical NTP hydrolase)
MEGDTPRITTLDEYQEKAVGTAVYPGRGNNQLIYPTIALVGEAGELANKVYHAHMENEYAADPELKGPMTVAISALLVASYCGDIMEVIKKAYRNDPQGEMGYERVDKVREGIRMLTKALTYLEDAISGGGRFEFPPVGVANEASEEMSNEAGDVLWYIAAFCREAHFDLGRVANENVAKLLSRKQRGVIAGSGDNR